MRRQRRVTTRTQRELHSDTMSFEKKKVWSFYYITQQRRILNEHREKGLWKRVNEGHSERETERQRNRDRHRQTVRQTEHTPLSQTFGEESVDTIEPAAIKRYTTPPAFTGCWGALCDIWSIWGTIIWHWRVISVALLRVCALLVCKQLGNNEDRFFLIERTQGLRW